MPVPEHDPLDYPPPNPSPPTLAGVGSRSSSNSSSNKWGPYSGAGDFRANMATILAVLFCAFVVIVTLNVAVRFLLRRRRSQAAAAALQGTDDVEKQGKAGERVESPEAFPTLVFSGGKGEEEEEGAECAICLAEFVNGDAVRVLPACSHGFHVRCVEKWLASRPSCPTCRSSCKVTEPSSSSSSTARGGREESRRLP